MAKVVKLIERQRLLPISELAKEWAAAFGKAKDYARAFSKRVQQSSWEGACWGALMDVGLQAEARALQVLARDGAGRWVLPGDDPRNGVDPLRQVGEEGPRLSRLGRLRPSASVLTPKANNALPGASNAGAPCLNCHGLGRVGYPCPRVVRGERPR